MHIDRANLNNLTQLWQRYGACSLYENDQLTLRKNTSWPNRVWADMGQPVSATGLAQTAERSPARTRFPLWPAITDDGSAAAQITVDTLVGQSVDWQPAFQHTAMVLPLSKTLPTSPEVSRHPLRFKRLHGEVDLAAWVATGSKAFGYSIDAKVIAPLLACEDIQILLAYDKNAEPVATGLLFKTGAVVGIHQIGVPAQYQGKGYATQMMRFLIQSAEQWQTSHVVLQASAAGKPVYKKLGFVEQFLISYLQRL